MDLVKERLTQKTENVSKIDSTFKYEKLVSKVVQRDTPILVKKTSSQNASEPINQPLKSVDKIEKEIKDTLKKETQHLSQQKDEPTNYISAQDLLFGRALEETDRENNTSPKSKLGIVIENPIKPKNIEIMGVSIYNSENKEEK